MYYLHGCFDWYLFIRIKHNSNIEQQKQYKSEISSKTKTFQFMMNVAEQVYHTMFHDLSYRTMAIYLGV